MATKFPGQIDTFPTMLDITADDAELVRQYQTAMEAGSYDVAQQILTSLPDGQRKIISAGLMNDVLDGLTATETYFAKRYSPAYIVSEAKPDYQEPTDFWFHITGEADL